MRFSFVSKHRGLTLFVVLAAIVTVISLAIYLVGQQTYRMSANDPQVDASEQISTLLSQGAPAAAIVGQSAPIDLSKSLSLFVIIYDKDGKVAASSGSLNSKTPELPKGIIDYVKAHGSDRFTWQPQKGVRIAAVMLKVDNDGGYVLVGRSLREVEKRIDQLTGIVGIAWLVLLLLAAKLTWVLGFNAGTQNITVVENTEVMLENK